MEGSRARLVIGVGVAALAVVLAFTAVTLAGARPSASVEIVIRHSKFVPDRVVVPVGVPVTVTLRNDDPIDHEWIVGDDAVHAVHRTGTEPLHPDRPTEVVIPALERRTTTITFEAAGSLAFICHLPAHEAYGMTGVLTIR